MRLHKSERVELHTCGRCHHLCIEEYGASSGGGRHCWSVQSIKRKFGLGPASGSQRDLTSTPQRPLCAKSSHSITNHNANIGSAHLGAVLVARMEPTARAKRARY